MQAKSPTRYRAECIMNRITNGASKNGIAGRKEPVMVNRDRRMQESAKTVMEGTEDCIEQSPKTERLK